MKQRILVFGILAIAAAVLALPAGLIAQPGTQPYAFYSEEPWGGSYLGVDTDDITSDRLGVLHLKEERGVEVTMVDQDAPAAKAGLKEHDVILTINDQQVESVEQLRRLIREIPAGRTISIGISRNGQPMTVKAQLAERSKMGNMDHAFNFTMPPVNIPAIHIPPINMPEIDVANVVVIHSPVRSGLMIENLTPQLGEFFGVKTGNGVLVRSVERGSRGETAGFHAGDVIVKINGSAVNDCSDFTRLLRKGTDNKAAVTVLREKREQNLTLTLPEVKRTGALIAPDGDVDGKDCADLIGPGRELSALKAQLAILNKSNVDTQMLRLKPELEKLQKEYRQKVQSQQGELKKQMESMQKDMLRHKDEMQKQMKEWWGKESEI
ncbi:MAG TPA: PDZ domain-containing protein [Terriglobales bacterium]|jgi:membrane-associated protease RseP (regulator of RpoE activity)